MLHYRGISYCSASNQCATQVCDRKVTPEVQAAADRWWGGPGAPFAFMNFSDRCGEFQPIEETQDGRTARPA